MRRAQNPVLLWPRSQEQKRCISSFPPSCLSALNSVLQYNVESLPNWKSPHSLIWSKSRLSLVRKANAKLELISGCMCYFISFLQLSQLCPLLLPQFIFGRWILQMKKQENILYLQSSKAYALFLVTRNTVLRKLHTTGRWFQCCWQLVNSGCWWLHGSNASNQKAIHPDRGLSEWNATLYVVADGEYKRLYFCIIIKWKLVSNHLHQALYDFKHEFQMLR